MVTALHDVVGIGQPGDSKYDMTATDMETKNELNGLNADSFQQMREHHEPYFHRVREFLGNPVNAAVADLYHEVVDELRMKVAAEQHHVADFADVLIVLYNAAIANSPDRLRRERRVLNILLSFMYFNCDIGRKDASGH